MKKILSLICVLSLAISSSAQVINEHIDNVLERFYTNEEDTNFDITNKTIMVEAIGNETDCYKVYDKRKNGNTITFYITSETDGKSHILNVKCYGESIVSLNWDNQDDWYLLYNH